MTFFNKAHFVALASAALLVSTPAFAEGDGWGSGSGWGGSWTFNGQLGGVNQNEAQGFGENVETFAKTEDSYGMFTGGNLSADPNCSGECGDTTFSANWFSNQTGMSGALATDSGHGNAHAGAMTAFETNASGGGEFGFSSGM